MTPVPRWLERLGGLFILGCSVWLTWFAWKAAHTEGGFLSVGAVGPGFALTGLTLILFPGYRSERLARGESLDGKEGWELLTPRWKVVMALAIVLSAGYFFALARGK
jgi:hypothetical protein